jgi:hypothetical protein
MNSTTDATSPSPWGGFRREVKMRGNRSPRRIIRKALIAIGLCAALLVPMLTPRPAFAAELTSVDVSDPTGLALDAKVAVSDATTGLPVASGRTDTLTGRFSFSSLPDSEFIVTVNTVAGYVGAQRVASGATISVTADTSVADLLKVGYAGDEVSLADCQGVENEKVNVMAWSTFQPVASGETESGGTFDFQVPAHSRGITSLPSSGTGHRLGCAGARRGRSGRHYRRRFPRVLDAPFVSPPETGPCRFLGWPEAAAEPR